MTLVIGVGEKARALRKVDHAITAEEASTRTLIGDRSDEYHANINAHHGREDTTDRTIKTAEALGVSARSLDNVRRRKKVTFVIG